MQPPESWEAALAFFSPPSVTDAPYEDQARVDPVHQKILAAASHGSGVVSGCEVTASGGDSVSVAAGRCIHDTNVIEVAAQSVSIPDGHATLPRHDLIVISEAGVASRVAGTPAARPYTQLPEIPSDSVAVASVWVPEATTAVAADQVTPLGVQVFIVPTFDGEPVQRASLVRMIAYGHSLILGTGASEQGRAAVEHLTSMLQIRTRKLVNGNAVLHWHQSGGAAGTTGDGGWAWILQNEQKVDRVSTLLNGAASDGQKILTVDSTTGMAVGDLVHVGTGTLGATGGETGYIATVDSGTQVTLRDNLARDHLDNEPVYVVPTAYMKSNPSYMLWYTITDLGAAPIASTLAGYRDRFFHSMRLAVNRFRAAEIYEESHTSFVFTGSWAATTSATSINSGSGLKAMGAVNDKVTWHLPDNAPGTACYMNFVTLPAVNGDVLTYRVDGTQVGTITLRPNDSGKDLSVPIRFTGLSPGRHVLDVELTTSTGTGTIYFDHAGIEATIPPLVVCPKFHRLPDDYSGLTNNAVFTNRPRTTLLNGTEAAGQTVITVDSTTDWMAGTTIIFEPGTGNEEVRVVQTVDSATQVTLTAATSLEHLDNTTVRTGACDADVATLNTLMDAWADEYDDRVLLLEVDTLVNANSAYFASDLLHFNDAGQRLFARDWYTTLMGSTGLSPTLLADTSVTVSPLPSRITWASLTQFNMAAADTELGAGSAYRQIVDMSRVSEIVFSGAVSVAGAAGAKVWLEYSLDSGSTWKSVGRASNMAHDSTTARDRCGFSISSTGVKTSPGLSVVLPPDMLQHSGLTWFRIMGTGGDGALDPAFYHFVIHCT